MKHATKVSLPKPLYPENCGIGLLRCLMFFEPSYAEDTWYVMNLIKKSNGWYSIRRGKKTLHYVFVGEDGCGRYLNDCGSEKFVVINLPTHPAHVLRKYLARVVESTSGAAVRKSVESRVQKSWNESFALGFFTVLNDRSLTMDEYNRFQLPGRIVSTILMVLELFDSMTKEGVKNSLKSLADCRTKEEIINRLSATIGWTEIGECGERMFRRAKSQLRRVPATTKDFGGFYGTLFSLGPDFLAARFLLKQAGSQCNNIGWTKLSRASDEYCATIYQSLWGAFIDAINFEQLYSLRALIADMGQAGCDAAWEYTHTRFLYPEFVEPYLAGKKSEISSWKELPIDEWLKRIEKG